MTPAGEEMAIIRKENKRLKEEVGILKATSFFANES